MDDFVAHASRWRIALMTLFCWAGVAFGFWIIDLSNIHSIIFGGMILLTSAAVGIESTKMLFDGREQLRIGSAGIRWVRWSEQTIPWSEIADVTTWSYRGQKGIALHLRDRNRFPGHGVLGMLAGANRVLGGGDICVVLTGTDRKFEDAFAAVEHFRSLAV